MRHRRKNSTATIAVIGSLILAIILVAGTIWMGSRARRDTEAAVRSVSLLYLDELAGRREQVVEDNLQEMIQTICVAVDLMTAEDLTDKAHLEAYQTRMKQLYHLDKFPRLFDTFSQEDSSTTTKYGSTGLGMAITKSIINLVDTIQSSDDTVTTKILIVQIF